MKYALRVLSRQKAFVTLAGLSLGVAISLASVVYALFDAVISPRLSIVAPTELRDVSYRGDWHGQLSSATKNLRLASMATVSGAAGTLLDVSQTASKGAISRPIRVRRVSPNFFAVLGVRPAAGRLLSDGDAQTAERPVVLSERMWSQWFPGQAWSAAATIVMNGDPRVIVGTVPVEADFPGGNTDIWELEAPSHPLYRNLIRMRPGVTDAALYAELKLVAAQFAQAAGESPSATGFTIRPAIGKPFQVLGFQYALAAAVLAVFLVACLNLANLQLARGMRRSREFSTLAAVGATRLQVVAVMMREVGILCVVGLALSLWMTVEGVKVVQALTPPTFDDYLIQPQLSWRVFGFSFAGAIAATLLVGLLPAIRLSGVEIGQSLRAGGEALRSHRAWASSLLVGQVTLSLVVLLAAALLVRTVLRVNRFDLGPSARSLVYASMIVSPRANGDTRRVVDVRAQVSALVQAEPLIANTATSVSFSPPGHSVSLASPGRLPTQVDVGSTGYLLVSSTYLRTLGTPIVAGRDFEEGSTSQEVIITKSLANWLWPGEDAVGKQIKLAGVRSDAPWLSVVGVALDMPNPLTADMADAAPSGGGRIYVSAGIDSSRLSQAIGITLLARATTADSAARLRAVMQRRMLGVGNGIDRIHVLPWGSVQYLDDLRQRQSFVASIFALFGLVAGLVAWLGVYAAFAQRVGARAREFAIRMALGASASSIRRLVREEARRLLLVAVGLGLMTAGLTVQWLSAFVRSGEDRYDPLAFGSVALVVLGVMSLASWLPAAKAPPANLAKALGAE